MSKDLIFFVPYHTGYAHVELIHSFASYTDVHLFIYKWNPAQQRLKEYFTSSPKQIHLHEFSLDNLLAEFLEQKHRKIVVLLTASTNYRFGQIQLHFFRLLQQHIPTLIDVYSAGHCMYGCQSCAYAYTHCLPITFTNYIRTRDDKLHREKNFEILICPSYSFEGSTGSLLSNSNLIDYFLTMKSPHAIKLHPLAYEYEDKPWEHPFLSLTDLEKDHVRKLTQSKNLLSSDYTNTLKLIEQARIIICDSNSSIPFEALYFQDGKYLFVYEIGEDYDEEDDRGRYFHKFQTVEQLNDLLDAYSNNRLECRTTDSHEFFREKYLEPDGKEIERLVDVRQWITDEQIELTFDRETIKQAVKDEFQSSPTPMILYALGEHTIQDVIQTYFQEDNELFGCLQKNVSEL